MAPKHLLQSNVAVVSESVLHNLTASCHDDHFFCHQNLLIYISLDLIINVLYWINF